MHRRTGRTVYPRKAFTLIELMVVIAIIGLLIAVLLPAFGTVRTKARYAQARAQFQSLDTGLNMFRSEENLGGTYPPSASDNPDDRQLIADPKGKQSDHIRIAGAHLLVHAMIGADGLGTPGFRDLDRDGYWWNDTYGDPGNSDSKGAYALDAEGREKVTRYGGAGYVDDKMKERAESLKEKVEEGGIVNLDCDSPPNNIACEELVFMDPWDMPILYYRASSASIRIVGEAGGGGGAAGKPGIFWQEDNGVITGTETGPYATDGLDFGPGKVDGQYHAIYHNESPEPTQPIEEILEEEHFEFARFILDPSVKARPTPFNKDTYLLISAGPDARYGTDDDVTNWTRKVE